MQRKRRRDIDTRGGGSRSVIYRVSGQNGKRMKKSQKKPSLKLNMILNGIRGVMGILFPVITFPYVSRILGVDRLGRYNFAASIISYFILLSGLGIQAYAVREGAGIRDMRQDFKRFCDEMFTVHILSSIGTYLLLAILLVTAPVFRSYEALLFILSLQIVFKAIGIEWMFSIQEEYAYITFRSMLFQMISLILLFVFVKTENDINRYAAITVISGAGSNLLNFIYARKYCRIGFTKRINWKKHTKPIMILFAMSLTVTVYVSSDITVLGFLCGDRAVGIYAVSSRIYTIVKNILSSVIIVSIPRLSALSGKGSKEDFCLVAEDIYRTLLTLVLPAVTGILILNREIILFIAGPSYLEASLSLCLLSAALFFCFGAYFWGQCILVPMKHEQALFRITLLSAVMNVVLNLILIPLGGSNAAAFTTVIAEGVAYFYSRQKGKKYINLHGIKTTFGKSLIGCAGITGAAFICRQVFLNSYVYTISTITVSVLVYAAIEFALKNQAVTGIIYHMKFKLRPERFSGRKESKHE